MPAEPERFGDVVLARKDAPTSYHLAVTVDDAAQGLLLHDSGFPFVAWCGDSDAVRGLAVDLDAFAVEVVADGGLPPCALGSLLAHDSSVTAGDMRDAEEFLDGMFRVRHGLLTVRTMAAQSAGVYGRMQRLAVYGAASAVAASKTSPVR